MKKKSSNTPKQKRNVSDEEFGHIIQATKKVIYYAKILDELPLTKNPVEKAIAIQLVAVMNLVDGVTEGKYGDELGTIISRAMHLRALIEVVANINYIVKSNKKEELSKRFLETEKHQVDTLRQIVHKKPVKRFYWADVSISKRISILAEDMGIDYAGIYHFLSSFVHNDSGFMLTLRNRSSEKYASMFITETSMIMTVLMTILYKAKFIEENYQEVFITELKSQYAKVKVHTDK